MTFDMQTTKSMMALTGIDQITALLQQNRTDLQPIALAYGESDFPIHEYVNLALTSEEVNAVRGYSDILGRKQLREKISHFYASTLEVEIPTARICITDGATGALVLALGILVTPGSEVIIPAIRYSVYSRIIEMFGGRPIAAPLDQNFNVDLKRLAPLISEKTVAILVNSPGNPCGNITGLETLEAITSYGVPVIFDEVYQALTVSDSVAPSALELPGEHFIVNGLSKSFAVPGFRVGFLIVPSRYLNAAQSLKATLNPSTSNTAQILAERLLSNANSVLEAHRAYIRHSRDAFLSVCKHYEIRLVTEPRAGFYGMLDLEGCADSMTVAQLLAKEYAVAVAPGIDFTQNDPSFLRVNFTGNTSEVEEAVRRIAVCIKAIKNGEHHF